MYLFLRLVGLWLILLTYLVKPIFWIRNLRKKEKVSKVQNDILLCSATELARRIREKEVSSEYVIRTYIQRIEKVNPIINAVSDERFDEAIKEAKEVDRSVQKNVFTKEQMEVLKPFYGVPITIKESCGMEGVSQAVGSLRRIGIKANYDCITVTRVKQAGFIPLLVSNCPEYCVGLETINHIIGITRNPYDTNKSAGGSSGGEAALLASAASIVGIGSDFAGSIRIPCLFNGVFGHKVTPRVIPRKGHFPDINDEESYDYFTIGPMTRYAIDLLPLLKVISSVDGIDLHLDEKVDLRNLKVYYTSIANNNFGIPKVKNQIVSKIMEAVGYMREIHGMKSEEIKPRELCDSAEIVITHFFHMKDCPNFLQDLKNPDKELSLYFQFLKSFIKKSEFSILLLVFILIKRLNGFVPKSKYPYYYNKGLELKAKLLEKLGNDGVFLYPSFTNSAFHHYQNVLNPLGSSYSMIFNILGFPTTSVPMGFDKNGMPIGLQIVVAPKMDRLGIAVAQELEKLFGGWSPPY